MKHRLFLPLFLLVNLIVIASNRITAQEATLSPAGNLVTENIPAIPLSVVAKANQYGESRPSTLYAWHPTRREMLIGTRFGDVPQVHAVKMPGGARTQLTFFPDRVQGATYAPSGDYFIFHKDVGGGEWYQYYRYDLPSCNITLLTD